MAISEEDRIFVKSLLDYYIGESDSYRQMAQEYAGDGSIPDTAFGIIVGCVYAGFMQACQGRQEVPGLEEMRELGGMIGARAGEIREAVGWTAAR